jgi:putative redox protein
MISQRTEFRGAQGDILAARLDAPAGAIRAYALFAHCFTCGKDVLAARRIAQGLTAHGIAVLRFDFTGVGASGGEFANTNFSSNVADLVAAAAHLRQHFAAPLLLIGHSLGGTATLAAASQIPEARAVVTIAAPSNPGQLVGLLGSDKVAQIEAAGEAEVQLAGRPFRIKRQFLLDAAAHQMDSKIGQLRKALLVMHSPLDDTVDIANAMHIFTRSKHPKSFVSLDGADHLVSRKEDAAWVANLIAAWSQRYQLLGV